MTEQLDFSRKRQLGAIGDVEQLGELLALVGDHANVDIGRNLDRTTCRNRHGSSKLNVLLKRDRAAIGLCSGLVYRLLQRLCAGLIGNRVTGGDGLNQKDELVLVGIKVLEDNAILGVVDRDLLDFARERPAIERLEIRPDLELGDALNASKRIYSQRREAIGKHHGVIELCAALNRATLDTGKSAVANDLDRCRQSHRRHIRSAQS